MHVQNIMLMYVIYVDACSFWHIYAQCICMFMHILYIHNVYSCLYTQVYVYIPLFINPIICQYIYIGMNI